MIAIRNRVVLERGVQVGFRNLQTIYASKSQKHIGDDDPAYTKLDKSLLAKNNLYAIAVRLENANKILESCGKLLLDKGRARFKRNRWCMP